MNRHLLRGTCVLAVGWGLACAETIEPPGPPASVTITPDTVRLQAGDTSAVSVSVRDSAGNALPDSRVTWTSSNGNVVTVTTDGSVIAAYHTDPDDRIAIIRARVHSIMDSAAVVISPLPVAAVALDTDSLYLGVGMTRSLAANITDHSGNDLPGRSVAWTVGDTAIAQVSQDGDVTGVSAGSTHMVVTAGGQTDTAMVVVGNLFVAVVTPGSGTLQGDTIHVSANVQSAFQINTVLAIVGTDSTPMVRPPGQPWAASVSIAGEAYGSQQVHVHATDVFGAAHTGHASFVYDPPPMLSVTAPTEAAVASPLVTLTASCTDRNAVSCATITAEIVSGPQLATGTASIDLTTSLAAYQGQSVDVRFTASDSAGQSVSSDAEVFVFDGTALTRLVDVPGPVLDYDGNRTLYATGQRGSLSNGVGTGHIVYLRDSTTGDVKIFDVPGRWAKGGKAYLFPGGAIFATDSIAVSTDDIREYRNGVLTTLANGYASTLARQNTWAAWLLGLSGTPLYLRDLLTGQTTTVVAPNAGNTAYDVSANGDVAYWNGAYEVAYTPLGGSPDTLSTGPERNTYPVTDGQNVVYRKKTATGWHLYFAPVSGSETQLAGLTTLDPDPHVDYETENGWIAYTEQSPSQELQVWSRSPTDVTRQVTFFGTSSRIEALNGQGSLIVRNGSDRYRADAPYTALTPIGPYVGKVIVRGGEFYLIVGAAVFAIP